MPTRDPSPHLSIGVISPQDWGLRPCSCDAASPALLAGLGINAGDLERRIHQCVSAWVSQHFDRDQGVFFGFYNGPERRFEPPQTVNLIAPWLLLAWYDRNQSPRLLADAQRAADWFYDRYVVSHPMSVAIGGVRERLPDGDLWTKFAAEFVVLSLGLYARGQRPQDLARARQSGMFLIQSARHGCAPRYDPLSGTWRTLGWQSFGRAVTAHLLLARATGESVWDDQARLWGELGLSLTAADGGLYLIDGDYFNTDLVADELRAFVFLAEHTREIRFMDAARRVADWLLARQADDGSWPLTIDRDGHIVVPTVGPGDMPNIAVALLRLHARTNDERYRLAALRALRYGLTTQITPEGDPTHAADPNLCWGFWSWMPPYDYTVSGDQATHHIRGLLFALDYAASEAGHRP